ncbi:MAG TPA: Ldh family oxidoreductase [Candidatus Binatia bacterium]|nr:Ldh family oxidoreductase [Candidatus Binatia bacterium]
MPKFNSGDLLQFSQRLLAASGIPAEHARLVAKLLVQADLRGYPGHGVTRIRPYLAWIEDGTIQLAQQAEIIREGKTTAVIDGHHYLGQVIVHDAMQLAIHKAREHGVGIVCIRRASHCGRLADYVEMAADEGMIGAGAVSVGAGNTAPHGAMQRVTGTNPMAFGIPGSNRRHFILDFATSAMSMGEIQKRLARGETIPEGVLMDGHGKPTCDFVEFRGPPRGMFLPFGGYKGSGVALITELLGGALTGNGLGRDWWEKGGHGVNGVFLQAIAVEEFQPLDEFTAKVDELASFVKSRKPAPGFSEIFLPGEQGRRHEERQLRDGIEIDEGTWSDLIQLANNLNIELPQPIASFAGTQARD